MKIRCAIGVHKYQESIWRRRCDLCKKVQIYDGTEGAPWRNSSSTDVHMDIIKLLRKLKVV